MEVKTYTAVAQRSGDWWAISVPEVRGVFTQAKRLDQVERMAREAIALVLDAPESQVSVSVSVHLPNELDALRQDVIGLRADIDDKKDRYKREFAKAVASLTRDMDLSIRDVASILGVSFQRVSQVDAATPNAIFKVSKAARVAPRKAAQAAARKAAPAVPRKAAKAAAAKGAPTKAVPAKAAKAAPRKSAAAQAQVNRKAAAAVRRETAASRRDAAARRGSAQSPSGARGRTAAG